MRLCRDGVSIRIESALITLATISLSLYAFLSSYLIR